MASQPQSEGVPMHVYTAIAHVAATLAKTGISKDRENKEQRFKFRGIDQVYQALAPLLVEQRLVIIPRMLSRELHVRTTKSGGAMYDVTVHAAFDFVSAVDGSKHTAQMYGEGMDTADKATNKAMSAAYKYVCFQTFCIPVEGDPDADADTHEETVVEEKRPEGLDQFQAKLALAAEYGEETYRKAWAEGTTELRKWSAEVHEDFKKVAKKRDAENRTVQS